MSGSMQNDGCHVSDDTCVNLLLEQLAQTERAEVLQHLSSCADCEGRFQELARQWEHAAVRVPRLVSAAPLSTRPAVARSLTSRVTKGRLWAMRWLVPAAVAVVIAVLLVVPRVGEEPRRPSLVKLPVLSDAVQPRVALPPYMSEAVIRGVEAYNRDDFATAIEAFESVDSDGPLDAFRRVYLASSLAWSGRYADVAAVLRDVPFELVPEPWSSEARWTLYVALAATGDTARADALLRELQAAAGPVGERARRVHQR